MLKQSRSLLLLACLAGASVSFAQVRVGGKVGANYAIGSQTIQPNPKDPPTDPKGLGMQFGAYIEVPFSDLVGIRPELAFSFRKMKMEESNTIQHQNVPANVNNQTGTFTGSQEIVTETDQRLTYFQVNAPLTISPAEGLRIMVGPSFNFLMGGRQNIDVTAIAKGQFTPQGGQASTVEIEEFETSKKKGSSAIRDFRKADIMAMAGIGYTLDIGFDMDLRYYRSLSTTFDRSQGSSRHRIWTNLIEFSLGWTFGGG